MSGTGISGVVPWQLVLVTCVASYRSYQEVTGVTLEGDRLPRDTHPAPPMAGTQMPAAPCGRGPQGVWWKTAGGCSSICNVCVRLLASIPFPFESYIL